MRSFLTTFFLIIISQLVLAQGHTGTIQGRVLDADDGSPLPFANVVLSDSSQIGTTTDDKGYFVLSEIPTGRQTLLITYLGYEKATIPNVFVQSGKTASIEVKLKESFTEMEEVVVEGSVDKTKTDDPMAKVSARTFSVEETDRYAGSRNDVARMATNFAGTSASNDATNDIVIRGNNSRGLLWRLEGVDIPNPNHFGQFGATGGPVSMLNNNVLKNSTFYTGAFPAQYGNALAGVFDLEMRNGNNREHEFMGQVGFNGFEGMAEGPINKDKHSSYLVNYRYSTLGVLQAVGFDFGTGSAIPQFQDMSFKVNMPETGLGEISVFGLGGISEIEFLGSEADPNDDPNFYTSDEIDIYNQTRLGVIGLEHRKRLGEGSYLGLSLATTYFENTNRIDTFDFPNPQPARFANEKSARGKLFAHLKYKKKFNSRANFKSGFIYSLNSFELNDEYRLNNANDFTSFVDISDQANQYQPYATMNYRLTPRLEAVGGLHANIFPLTNSVGLSPRLALDYQLTDKDVINIAYGRHSQLQPLSIYFNTIEDQQGRRVTANDDLDLTHSNHFVLGYEHFFSDKLRIKAEGYYQHINDAVVSEIPSSISLLNFGAYNDLPDSLRFFNNSGKGRNYGLELTIEQFMKKGFYYLATVSLFQSEYQGSDGNWYETAFNNEYVVNALIGNEFKLFKAENREKKKSLQYLSLDLRSTYAGGQRYIPIDLEASKRANEAVYDYSEGFAGQFRDYFRLDFDLRLRSVGKKISQEFGFSVQNITNRRNPLLQRYNAAEQKVETINQIGFFFVPEYRIYF